MASGKINKEEEQIASDVQNLKLEAVTEPEGEANGIIRVKSQHNTNSSRSLSPIEEHSPIKKTESNSQSPTIKSPSTPTDMVESIVGGDITVKLEPGQAPKLARTASAKIISRPPPLFLDEPDKYEEATKTFEVIPECIYAAKWLGETEHAMECDCREAWDGKNHACDEDSDCINRLTKIECTGQGSCGKRCQNRRFKNKQYANVSVFKTEKKGYGLRANENLESGDFIFEYIGDVIDEPRFRKRMVKYDEEGVKHFYFMSLNKGEFVDATRKGNLGRFCNHSCNPNCYVDKWVVGDKLCMGIFAGRSVKAGEELVFNYNVDRYGANPQPCYCGEPNCTGYIGGKTQTERATKLSDATIEALGIEDGDSWDTATSRKPKKAKKTGENDEEYVNNVKPKFLEEDGVNNLMATLMQCKEKWIAVKLLGRIQRADEEKVIYRIVRMHGYRTLKITINEFLDDANVCLQVLDILDKFPRLSRNKIENSGIEEVIKKLINNEDENVVEKSKSILEEWGRLTVEYRIPRMKRDPNEQPEPARDERRDRRGRSRSPSKTRSVSPPHAPSGPRGNMPQRGNFFGGPRPPFRPRAPPPPPSQLPPGWFAANDAAGKTYYYSASGATQWTRPTGPANQPPPPPKIPTNEERLQQIINDCLKTGSTPVTQPTSAAATPVQVEEKPKAKKEEKWRSYSLEKQKKVYENTLFTHIKPIIDKFKGKLSKDDLKRHAKDITKKMVESDYKNNRVTDPNKLSSKQVKAIKKYVVDFFNKAVKKRREYEKKKREKVEAERQAAEKKAGSTTPPTLPPASSSVSKVDDEQDVQLSDDEGHCSDDEDEGTENGKRKRGSETPVTPLDPDGDESASKKAKLDTSPPPPPPPPPAEENDEEMLDSATPTQDISSLNDAAWNVNGGVKQEPSPSDTNEGASRDYIDNGEGILGKTNGHDGGSRSPVQLATPSTNGTYEHDAKSTDGKRCFAPAATADGER
ncbi:hypothetical protein EJ08DRAFT_331004 [Tothia fuscella]|uniref:Histone-lysine N-methyltransferase, H3 lysine-36 specific n=1 Tax=Tothia fuscella TaxID=1048955 RepID=A0A9P4NMY4_9PEZI|nr:hypothetical protein EJ08DRAFT_331004 [Tothia fuscella]